MTIPVGGTVTWTNNSDANVAIVATDGSFSSNTLSAGETFQHTFDTAGTYTYYDAMDGSTEYTVNVVQPQPGCGASPSPSVSPSASPSVSPSTSPEPSPSASPSASPSVSPSASPSMAMFE